METNAQRRIRKLKSLAERVEGGLHAIADRSGVTAVSLEQIIKGVLLPPKQDGTRSPRSLGDKAAHMIEDGMGLGRGWFDADDAGAQRISAHEPQEAHAALVGALDVISAALQRSDTLTRLSLEPLFQLWAKQPEESESITQRIGELLTKHAALSHSVDDAASRPGGPVKGRQRQPGFTKHGTSTRAQTPTRKSGSR